MQKIKVSTNFPKFPFERQTPGFSCEFNGSKFYINQEIDDFDFWIVYDDIIDTEIANCSHGCLILFTAEPESVLTYPKRFLEQFDVVVTSQENLAHKNKILNHTSLPWHIGRVINVGVEDVFTRNYDELSLEKIKKSKLLSVISSNKTYTKGHKQRLEFVKILKEYFGNVLDVYGRGLSDFQDKWDVIAPYKYHIVLENSSQNYYWTEKLSDCFLGESYPLYYGCKNLDNYFDVNSFSSIDICDPELAIKKIEFAIENNLYDKNLESLLKSKNLILNHYNFFSYAAKVCSGFNSGSTKRLITIKNQSNCFSLKEKGFKSAVRFYKNQMINLFGA